MTRVLEHCGRCGAPGISFDGGKRYECQACGWVFFVNPCAAVAVILEVDGKVLFTVRAHGPGAGMLDLPGGFVDADESAEDALRRELAEELGVDLPADRLRYIGSFPNRYTYAGVTYDTVDAIFTARLDTPPTVRDHDELADIELLAPAGIDMDRIAFASIRAAIGAFTGMGGA